MNGDQPATVTFIFPDKTGQRFGTCRMPWFHGRTVQVYLHEQPLKNEGLIARWMRSHTFNSEGQKIKLNYVPQPSDVITLRPAGKPLS